MSCSHNVCLDCQRKIFNLIIKNIPVCFAYTNDYKVYFALRRLSFLIKDSTTVHHMNFDEDGRLHLFSFAPDDSDDDL